MVKAVLTLARVNEGKKMAPNNKGLFLSFLCIQLVCALFLIFGAMFLLGSNWEQGFLRSFWGGVGLASVSALSVLWIGLRFVQKKAWQGTLGVIFLKYPLLFFGAFYLLTKEWAHVWAVALGLFTLVPSLVIFAWVLRRSGFKLGEG